LGKIWLKWGKIEQQKRPLFAETFPYKTNHLAVGVNVWDSEEILSNGPK
jgi:hypothetical protein